MQNDAQHITIATTSTSAYASATATASSPIPERTPCNEYRIEGQLRHVIPYFHEYTTSAKRRWYGRTLMDVYLKEFPYYTEAYLRKCIEIGRIRINGKRITTDVDEVVLKSNDRVSHLSHRHELPVLHLEIEFLEVSEDMIVLVKPSSIPVHPCGRYNKNSITHILEKEYNMPSNTIFPVYRLDRLTSGVLLIARSAKKAKDIAEYLQKRTADKMYIARVKGKFALNETILLDQNIDRKNVRLGIWETNPQGKYPSQTLFRGVLYSEEREETLLICKPLTGRTHQIRIHLQWLNFPISNDTCYGYLHEKKKENKKRPKPDDNYLEKVVVSAQHDVDGESQAKKRRTATPEEGFASAGENEAKKNDEDDDHITTVDDGTDALCPDCQVEMLPVDVEHDLVLYLHAWVYIFDDKRYESNLPNWCTELFGSETGHNNALPKLREEMATLMDDASKKNVKTLH